jgi:hypothetical protein
MGFLTQDKSLGTEAIIADLIRTALIVEKHGSHYDKSDINRLLNLRTPR